MKNEVKVTENTIIVIFSGMQAIRNVNNILFCKSVCHYTEIYFDTEKPIKALIGINKLALLLPGESFYKCHRRYIVHLGIVQEAIIKEGKILFREHVLPITRNCIAEFRCKAEVYHTSHKSI
jgi:DNA-binding LytR/AlgR family response regulator